MKHSKHFSSPGHEKGGHHEKRHHSSGHPHTAMGKGHDAEWGYAEGAKLHVTATHPIDGDGGAMSAHELQHADYSSLTGGYSTEK